MQVYDALHILTAHPSIEDQKKVPHELYGYLHPNDPCSAGNWCEVVQAQIQNILNKGKSPIVVGGSGLYLHSLMEGLSPVPDIPDDIRAAAVAKQQEMGNPNFYALLQERDPVMAQRFHPYHTARLIRAWEVLEATGKSLAQWQEMPRNRPPSTWQFDVTLVIPPREKLYRRCNERFDWMLENGALEEVQAFFEKIDEGDVRPDVPLIKALGARVLRDYIQGKLGKDEAIARGKAETRQYAKRQTTWFKHQIKPAVHIVSLAIKT